MPGRRLLGGGRVEVAGAGQAGGAAAGGGDQGELAGRLVDHVAVQHGGAAALGGVVGVGLKQQLGPVVVVLGRGELGVDDVDLGRVQDPLAVVAQGGDAGGAGPQAVAVVDGRVRAVDGLQAAGPRGDQDAQVGIVERVATPVPGGLLADLQ